MERDFSSPRGSIITADGEVVARSVPSNDQYKLQREYPTGELFAHVTGYFAFELGSAGLERSYNDELAGRTIDFDLQKLSDLFVDRERVGNLTLTMRNDVQEVARRQLGATRRFGRGARSPQRRDPGHVVVPLVRPQRAGHPQLQCGGGGFGPAQRQPR